MTMPHPRSLEEVAALMRDNLPTDVTLSTFGAVIGWGRGDEDAKRRISTLKRAELESIGLSAKQAEAWTVAYEAVRQLSPNNPSAAGRAELMRYAVKLLGGAN